MRLAVVGATGLVGTEILNVLEEKKMRLNALYMVASARSVGEEIVFRRKKYKVISMEEALALAPDVAIFSAGGSVSLEWAPKFASVGTTVIDNSSAWRMDPEKKLVVPEVNGFVLTAQDKIIANPNCSTIQMVVAINRLHRKYRVKRIVVSTYQSVTGSGKKAVDQLMNERQGIDGQMAYKYNIDLNLIPQIDVFLENGYTKEEMKMVHETKKIMGDDRIRVTATAVRVPVIGGHSESLNIEFGKEFDLSHVFSLLSSTPGVCVLDDTLEQVYPMPKTAQGSDLVYVGRIRRDDTQYKTLNMWVVADNLRKGAATNAVQIAQLLLRKKFV
jgi:aspartate-semialdehyde dehydrogenase